MKKDEKMKNSNILGVHSKIQLLGGKFTKNQYRRGDCLKRGAWTVWRFKGGREDWRGRGGSVFEGRVDTLMLIMQLFVLINLCYAVAKHMLRKIKISFSRFY